MVSPSVHRAVALLLFMMGKNPEQGCQTTLHAAMDKAKTGLRHLADCRDAGWLLGEAVEMAAAALDLGRVTEACEQREKDEKRLLEAGRKE